MYVHTMFKYYILADITNPKVSPGSKEAVKTFNFDYSYWSHDVSENGVDFDNSERLACGKCLKAIKL